MAEALPLDPGDLARHVAAGHVCHIGDALVVCLDGSDVRLACKRCEVDIRIPTSAWAVRMDEATGFMAKHQHNTEARS